MSSEPRDPAAALLSARLRRGDGVVGAWLQRLVVGAGLMVLGISVLAAALGALGWWRRELVLPLVGLGLVAVARAVARIPTAAIRTWPAVGLLLVTLGAGAWMQATHSELMLPRRDAGSNLQAAISLADSGSRVVAIDPTTIGAPHVLDLVGVTLASPAFFEVGSSAEPAIQPQFVIGPAALYSLGRWAGGLESMWALAPWVTAVGILALGLLVAVTVGGWWGVLAAMAIAVCFPIVHAGRSTYSEPLAMATLGPGLLAWFLAARADHAARGPDAARAARGPDAARADHAARGPHEAQAPARRAQAAARSAQAAPDAGRWGDPVGRSALFAGALIGGTAFVRVDGLRESLLVLPVAALGMVQRRVWPRPLLIGMVTSTLGAAAAGLLLSTRYLASIAGSLLPLLALGVVLVALSMLVVTGASRGRRLHRRVRAALPGVVGVATLAVGAGLAARPLWQTVRQDAEDPGSHVVAGLQLRQGLPVDGGRTYAEQSVTWLSWWVGVPALIVAVVTLAALLTLVARAWGDGRTLPAWTGPVVVAVGSTVLTLYRPGITPDHPWADRRLVIALPLVAVVVIVAAAYLWHELGIAGKIVAPVVVVALLWPTAAATWPHRGERVEAGSAGAIAGVCRALEPSDVVLAVDSRAANEWPQVIRGQCGIPALAASRGLRGNPGALGVAIERIRTSLGPSKRLVLLAADTPDGTPADVGKADGAQALALLGAVPRAVADVTVAEDDRLLEQRPDNLSPLPLRVWLADAPS